MNENKQESDRPIVIIERAVSDDAEAILTIKRNRWFDTYVSENQGITVEDIEDKWPVSDLQMTLLSGALLLQKII